MALIAQIESLFAAEQLDRHDNVLAAFPPVVPLDGRVVNTLNLTRPDGGSAVRLRGRYDRVLAVITTIMMREHPSNAAHATQSWPAYAELIQLLAAASPGERRASLEWVWQHGVLAAPQRRFAAVRERIVRPFEYALVHMPTTGRPGGALLQAFAFGYLRADSPNLIFESHSVNTSATKAGMLGDVDGFRGAVPELAAEVKDIDLNVDNVEGQLGSFLSYIAEAPNVTAVVICRTITTDARALVEERNVRVLDKEALIRTVAVWDLPKQQEALRAVEYWLARRQKSPELVDRFRNWLREHDLDAD